MAEMDDLTKDCGECFSNLDCFDCWVYKKKLRDKKKDRSLGHEED